MLRILLADEDDANAFLFQCGVNRLGRACAFQRINSRAALPEKLQQFRPDILIAAGFFAKAEQLRQMKQFTNGHPIICAVESREQAEAAFAAGATDCVLTSQVDELHACIEWHLSGPKDPPFFKKGFSRKATTGKSKTPSKLDLKLMEFDRWIGAKIRLVGVAAELKTRKLLRVVKAASNAVAQETRRRYKELKVQWLLRRQKNLIQSNLNTVPETASPVSTSRLHHEAREAVPTTRQSIRIVSPSAPARCASEKSSGSESFESDSFRTLELSFKTLFHTSLDPTFLLDGLGSFLHANAPGCTLLEQAPADLLGKTILEFVPVPERAQVSALWEALLIEGQIKSEIRLQLPSGQRRDVFISGRSNLWFGVHLLVLRDQTELNSLRAALRTQPAHSQITTPPPAHAAQESNPAAPTPAP